MDNYYTRHILARALKFITQGKARVVGTIKFTNVNATNRPFLTKAIASMKNEARGTWKLVRCYDKVEDLDKLQSKHAAAM
jgi:hypothetical protein